MLIARSPIAILSARKKILCPVCTVDEALPVMIEESEWEVHARSKAHKRLAAKRTERKQHVHILAAQGKGDRARGELAGADDPPIPFDGLFGT